MVERLFVRIHSCDDLLLAYLDFWSEYLPHVTTSSMSILFRVIILLIHAPLQIEFIYNAVQLVFTWTSLANFYLAFFFVCLSYLGPADPHSCNFWTARLICHVYRLNRRLQSDS